MATGEFDLIQRHFGVLGAPREDVILGVGDDAALLDPGSAPELAVGWASISLNPGQAPRTLGEACTGEAIRSLLDQGAIPAWATVALSMETGDDAWVGEFAAGVDHACARHGVRVVGGDTTSGPTTVTVFVTGPEKGGDGT